VGCAQQAASATPAVSSKANPTANPELYFIFKHSDKTIFIEAVDRCKMRFTKA